MPGQKRRLLYTSRSQDPKIAPSPTLTFLTFLTIFECSTSYPIFSRICDYLSIESIVSLTRTCRKFSGLYQYLIPIQWNVDKRLRRFVQDPSALRSQMGKCDALISGSFAIQFFERVTWPDSDLDFFVEQGEGCESFCKYLMDSEGYHLVRSKMNDDPAGAGYSMYDLMEVIIYALARSSGMSNRDFWFRSEPTPSHARILLRIRHRRKPRSKSSLLGTYRSSYFSGVLCNRCSQHPQLEQSLLDLSAYDFCPVQGLYVTEAR